MIGVYNIMNVWENAFFFQNVLSSLLVTGLVLVLYFSSKSEIIQNKSRGTFLSLTFNLRNYLSLERRRADRTDIYRVQLRLDDRRQTIPIAWRNGITAINNCALILKKTKIASPVLFLFCIYIQ